MPAPTSPRAVRCPGKYKDISDNSLDTLCPPPGQRVPLMCTSRAEKYQVPQKFCYKQIKGALFTDARPATCDPPAPTWTCTATSCWIDTSDRAAVVAAFKAFHGGSTFGASHGDYGYGAHGCGCDVVPCVVCVCVGGGRWHPHTHTNTRACVLLLCVAVWEGL
jgi:hypothetical protein